MTMCWRRCWTPARLRSVWWARRMISMSPPGLALAALRAALEAGARWLVLCDTNGGTLPSEVGRIVAEVIAAGIPGDHLGIHCHDDTGNAVANSLAAVDAGARQIQGTLNGLGER